jgi:hypothetical protein
MDSNGVAICFRSGTLGRQHHPPIAADGKLGKLIALALKNLVVRGLLAGYFSLSAFGLYDLIFLPE